MPRAFASSIAVLAGTALLSTLTACSSAKSGTESASATSASTAGASTSATAGATTAIALTTNSAEARDLYLKGRTLAENLRAHDGRQLFEQAAEKDPSFAMAHYQLAVNSGDREGFLRASESGGGTVRQGVGRGAADDSGRQGERRCSAEEGARLVAGAGHQVPWRRAGSVHPGRLVLRAAELREGDRADTRRPSRSIRRTRLPTIFSATHTGRSRSTPTPRRRSRSTSS